MKELTLLERGIIYSIIGTADKLKRDMREQRAGDENWVEYPIDWNKYAKYKEELKSLEKESWFTIRDWNRDNEIGREYDYFLIDEIAYNQILNSFR